MLTLLSIEICAISIIRIWFFWKSIISLSSWASDRHVYSHFHIIVIFNFIFILTEFVITIAVNLYDLSFLNAYLCINICVK